MSMLAMSLSDPFFRNALLSAVALGTACAVLSVPVVLRRWAFIGEGISHSGFGGAGTAWVLGLLFPAFEQPWVPYAAVIVFCTATALAIGRLSRGHRVSSDAAIGIFLVASLAWGFMAQQIYQRQRHTAPAWFDNLLFGQMQLVSLEYAVAAVMICSAVLLVVAALRKEILAYCFDPLAAQTSGVRAGFIHYLLMVLIALVIVIGVRVAGSVLVTALLVLPGATALAVSRRMTTVVSISVAVGLLGAVGGLLVNARWAFLPVGPSIVLTLFAVFLLCYFTSQVVRRGE